MKLPKFVLDGGFNWASKGYHYDLSEADRARIGSHANLDSPWEFLANAVEKAKVGDFSSVAMIRNLFNGKYETNVAPSALLITGDQGSQTDLVALTDVMTSGPDGLKAFACQAARNSGCLWLVPHMLAAWETCSGVDAHAQIGFAIADLLDVTVALDEIGAIGAAADCYDSPLEPGTSSGISELKLRIRSRRTNAEFGSVVRERFAEVLELCESDRVAVWGGSVFNVRRLCSEFLSSVTAPTFNFTQFPLTVVLREKIEASTGINCSNWYSGGRFVQGEAVHRIEEYLESEGSLKFSDGRRYFFGHPLS